MESVRPLASLALLLFFGAGQLPPGAACAGASPHHRHARPCLRLGSPGQPAAAQPGDGQGAGGPDRQGSDGGVAGGVRRYNVVRAVAGGRSSTVAWRAADPKRIIGGTMMPLPDVERPAQGIPRRAARRHGRAGFGHIADAPDDPQMEPYWALAEELDIPVGLHTGLAPPGLPTRAARNSATRSAIPRSWRKC